MNASKDAAHAQLHLREDNAMVLRDLLRSPVGVRALDAQSLLYDCVGLSRAGF
jgi:hypothetical protein